MSLGIVEALRIQTKLILFNSVAYSNSEVYG